MAANSDGTGASAAPGAIGFGTGFVDVDRAATQVGAVQAVNSGIGFRRIAHLDKGEAAGAARVTVRHQTDALHGAVRLKRAANTFLGSAEIQISYEHFFHELILQLADTFDCGLCEEQNALRPSVGGTIKLKLSIARVLGYGVTDP